MSTFNQDTIVLEALKVLGFSSPSTAERARADLWMNSVLRDVQSRDLWTELETTATANTVASQARYGMPSDYDKGIERKGAISFVNGTSNKPLIYLTQKQFDYLTDRDTSSGPPTHYTKWADQFHLYPIPGSVYVMTLRYYRNISDLTVTTDIPEFYKKWRPGLIAGVLAKGYRSLDDTQADVLNREYEDYISTMRENNVDLVYGEVQDQEFHFR